MAKWRDIKSAALQKVHATFQVAAVYQVAAGNTPIKLSVRIHSRGMMDPVLRMDDWTNGISNMTSENEIIFDVLSLPIKTPAQNGFVAVGSNEVYRIGVSGPVKDGYIRAAVSLLGKGELDAFWAMQNLTLPEWAGIYP
jgi:hypothetical protein